jgi:hypothetical protein
VPPANPPPILGAILEANIAPNILPAFGAVARDDREAILASNIAPNIGANMGYISRYIRERYVRRNIRRDLYERLVKWCGEASVNLCLEKALSILEANIGANIAPNTVAAAGTDEPATLAPNIAPILGANIAPNIGAGQPEPAAGTSGGYEWCRPRSSIRSLQGFLEWADGRFGLLDWWEEDGKICLATRRKPVKTE